MGNFDFDSYFKGIAKQINRAYRRGNLQRTTLKELMLYSDQTAQIANCLEHAIFNFTDEKLLSLVKKNGANIENFWRGFESLSSRFEVEPEEQALRDFRSGDASGSGSSTTIGSGAGAGSGSGACSISNGIFCSTAITSPIVFFLGLYNPDIRLS